MDTPKLYTPREVAKRLGISTRMLQYYRETGRIEGTFVGNTTLYTEEQIAAANLEKRMPGPKMPTDKADKSDTFALAG